MWNKYKAYICVFAALNMIGAIGFGPVGLVLLQLGPLAGPVLLKGDGCVWAWMLCTSLGLLFCSAFVWKHRLISVACYTGGLTIWYGAASVFILLLM